MTTDKLDNLLDDEGITRACDGCEYLHEWIEHHPYGMGTAGEDMAECTCHDDSLCPRLTVKDGICSYPECNCPGDKGPNNLCWRGFPNKEQP